MATYYSTKTYGTDRGLSCCFRQWRATHSHCSLLHGYSIGVKLIFEANTLDDKNWVQDFGGLDDIKKWLEHMFDHTTIIAEDDPQVKTFLQLAEIGGIIDLRLVSAVGCERFAEMVYKHVSGWLLQQPGNVAVNQAFGTPMQRVRLKSAEVFEHGANSAIYEG